MKLLRGVAIAWLYFCFATFVAEIAVLGVLWQRGQLTQETYNNLLIVAMDVPVRDIYDRMIEQAQPIKEEMVSFAEVESGRMLTNLDLDLRDLAADKGLADAQELDVLLQEETYRYSELKQDFDARWDALQKGTVDSQLQDVGRQLATIEPGLAKDQLLRILNDEQLDPEIALHQVVTIFRGLPIDKRKKIVQEFKDRDAASLHEIFRQIRLGMPQMTLIRETRDRLTQFRAQ